MLTIWKYQVEAKDYFEVRMPFHHTILSVQKQDNGVFIWALVNPHTPMRRVAFRLAGTGLPITETEDQLKYIGTFQLMEGRLVFHLFEILGE